MTRSIHDPEGFLNKTDTGALYLAPDDSQPNLSAGPEALLIGRSDEIVERSFDMVRRWDVPAGNSVPIPTIDVVAVRG